MNNRPSPHGRTEWDFWALALKIGAPALFVGILFWFAIGGNMVAIVALTAGGSVALVGLGVVMVLAIMDRAAAQEDARFRANTKENLAIAQQSARLQNTQMDGLLKQNRGLLRQAGELDRLTSSQQAAGGLDIDELFSGGWEIETVEAERLGPVQSPDSLPPPPWSS